jgi:hypothetical protein
MLVFSLMHNGLKHILNQSTFNTGFFHAKCDFFQWEQNLPCGREFFLIVMQNNERKKIPEEGLIRVCFSKDGRHSLGHELLYCFGNGTHFPTVLHALSHVCLNMYVRTDHLELFYGGH